MDSKIDWEHLPELQRAQLLYCRPELQERYKLWKEQKGKEATRHGKHN